MKALSRLLLISFLLFPVMVTARQGNASLVRKVSYRIPYRPAAGNHYGYGNSILREIAKDVLREPWLVCISVSCDLGLQVEKSGNRSTLVVSMKNRAVGGDTLFRRFPIAPVLFPSRISMKLRWANRADTSGFVEESLQGLPIPANDTILANRPVASYDPLTDTLLVREVELFYDSASLAAFYQHINLVHDYYASVAILDSLKQFSEAIALTDSTLLPVNYLKVEEVVRVLGCIGNRDIQGRLLADGFDPSGLMGKFRALYKYSRSLIYNYLDELHRIKTIPWDYDAGRLASFYTSRISSYVRRSFLMDQQQGQVYGDCLARLFETSVFPDGEDVAGMLLERMYPGARSDTLKNFMALQLYTSCRRAAALLIGGDHFAEAFAMMETDRRFMASAAPGKTSGDEPLLARAAEGICNAYVGIASTCIASHKFKMAGGYLEKAGQYIAAHAGYIRSDSAYRAVFSQLFFMRNADCDALLADKKYSEALDCYQSFELNYPPHDLALVSRQLGEKKQAARMGMGLITAMISEDALKHRSPDTALYYFEQARMFRQQGTVREPVDTRLDSLAPAMARIKYEQLAAQGAAALDRRQFTLAVNRFREARDLAASSGFDPSGQFDSLYRQAMKNFLVIQLSAARKKIWNNQFDSAAIALQNTRAAGFQFGLLNEPDFILAMETYRDKFHEQQCRNLSDSVGLWLIRGDRSAAHKNFVHAVRCYRVALGHAKSDTACRISLAPLLDSLQRYEVPAAYQENEMDANTLVTAGDYAGAVSRMKNNELLYWKAGLQRFGLETATVYSGIAAHHNPYLAVAAARNSLGAGLPQEALGYLKLVNDQQMAAGEVRELQEKVGKELARADMALACFPNEETSRVLQQYAVPGDWFDAFRAAYAAERSRLLKTQGKK